MIIVSLNEVSEAPKEVVKQALEHTNNLQNDLSMKNQQVVKPKVSFPKVSLCQEAEKSA